MNIYNTEYKKISFNGDMKTLENLTQKVIKFPNPANIDDFRREIFNSTTVTKGDGVKYIKSQLKELENKVGFGIKTIKTALKDGIDLFKEK